MKNILRKVKYRTKKTSRSIGKATGTSRQIALGMAIGFFVAWLPIIGIQMVVAIIICQIVKANKVVPIFPIWITNPVTLIPIYSFNYWVGWIIVGGPQLSEITKIFRKMIEIPENTTDGRLAAWWEGVKYSMGELLSMGWDMQLPLWLGCVIVGLCLAIPSYYITKKFVDKFRESIKKRRMKNAK